MHNDIPWTLLSKPLHRCRFALITTGGVHLKSDTSFNMEDKTGDASFRKIPWDTKQDDLMITHDYYDHRDADRDVNIVFPIDIARKCQSEGVLGESVACHLSFMGHITEKNLEILIEKTAREAADFLKSQGAEIALLVPS